MKFARFPAMKLLIAIVFLGFSLTACSARYLKIEPGYASVDCPVSQEKTEIIENQAQFENLVRRKSVFNSETALPKLDFSNHSYVLVAAGSKPQGGYRIELTSSKARLEGSTLYLPVEIVPPDPAMAQVQMLTSPCQVLQLPKVEVKALAVENK